MKIKTYPNAWNRTSTRYLAFNFEIHRALPLTKRLWIISGRNIRAKEVGKGRDNLSIYLSTILKYPRAPFVGTLHRQFRSPLTDRAGFHTTLATWEGCGKYGKRTILTISVFPLPPSSLEAAVPRPRAPFPHGACSSLFFLSSYFFFSFHFVFVFSILPPLSSRCPVPAPDNEDFLSEPLNLIDDRFS